MRRLLLGTKAETSVQKGAALFILSKWQFPYKESGASLACSCQERSRSLHLLSRKVAATHVLQSHLLIMLKVGQSM